MIRKFIELFKTYFLCNSDQIPTQYKASLFGMDHMLTLFLWFIFYVIMIFHFVRKEKVTQDKMLIAIALSVTFFELFRMFFAVYRGRFTWGNTLPLQLCALNAFFMPLAVITRKPIFLEYAYAVGFAGALAAMITPDVSQWSIIHYQYIIFYLIHGLAVFIPVFLIASKQFRPNYRNLPKVMMMLFGMSLIMYPINLITKGNYMFIMYGDKGTPLETFEKLMGYPGYFIPLILTILLVWFILYLPFGLKTDRVEK